MTNKKDRSGSKEATIGTQPLLVARPVMTMNENLENICRYGTHFSHQNDKTVQNYDVERIQVHGRESIAYMVFSSTGPVELFSSTYLEHKALLAIVILRRFITGENV